MEILLIGSGNRATAYAIYFKANIKWVCDKDVTKPPLLIEEYNLSNATAITDFRDADGYDAIIIATPDHTHLEIMEWAVGTGKPILLEKPVEVNTDALARLHTITDGYEPGIVLGFGLRYTFMYDKIMELLGNEAIGPVVSIEAAETLGELHAARFFRRWHRDSRLSGGMLNTKCSHDMDILNLAVASLPVKISSFGSNMLFRRERGLEKCSKECPEYDTCIYVDETEYVFSSVDTSICPYNIESDLVDHQTVNILYENGVTAVFTLSMHSAKGNRTIRIHGEKGSIEASFENQEVYMSLKNSEPQVFRPLETGGSHGGGDQGLCSFFTDCYKRGKFPNQIGAGILASAVALAADLSRLSGETVDFTEILNYIYGKK